MTSILGLGVMLVFTVVPIFIVIAIIAAIIRRSKEGEHKNDFEKNLRTIYVYLVTIIFLFALVFSVISMFNSGINVILPEKQVVSTNTSSEYLEASRKNRENSNIVDLMTSIAVFGVSLPLFMYHSRLAKEL
ncbi:hypothetical protein D3C76_1342140 [compost metagenome]